MGCIFCLQDKANGSFRKVSFKSDKNIFDKPNFISLLFYLCFKKQKNIIMIMSNKKYCIRRHMFFAVTNPIMETNLSKEEADKLCKEFNDDECKNGDGTYVDYQVHQIIDEIANI